MIEGVEGPFSSAVVAPSPREGGGEGGPEEVDSPGDDHVVVERDEEGDEDCTESDSWGLVQFLFNFDFSQANICSVNMF